VLVQQVSVSIRCDCEWNKKITESYWYCTTVLEVLHSSIQDLDDTNVAVSHFLTRKKQNPNRGSKWVRFTLGNCRAFNKNLQMSLTDGKKEKLAFRPFELA
jgi:hypothetical protein